MSDRRAPGELALIEELVNTADLEEGTDAIASPAALGEWLRSVGLASESVSFEPADVARIAGFREALRRLLLSHHGGEVDPQAVAELDAVAREVGLVVGFGADGAVSVGPSGSGTDAVLGRLLAVIARASAEGTWDRLKACPADDCHWAFYDFSRNHSRTWCDMQVCGNRAKARSYRARQGA
jgi:predicted RNA-binding Zn ribbon-like protein